MRYLSARLFDSLRREGASRGVRRRKTSLSDRALDPARILRLSDPGSGLDAVLAIDSTELGPAAGGIRTRAYKTVADAVSDATGLARAMTIKCALCGLDAGGAKAVVMDHPGLDRPRAFARLGELVEALGGLFRTAGDLGTTAADLEAMATTTRYVHTEEQDLTEAVARGLLRAANAALTLALGSGSTAGLRVAIQGVGSIGAPVARAFARAGAEVLLADTSAERAELVAESIGASVVSPETILRAEVDLLAPCAIGGVIGATEAADIRAAVVCGAANEILRPGAEAVLGARGILFVPDTIASAGAVIEGVGRTVMKLEDRGPLIDDLGRIAREVLLESRERELLASEVAIARALARIRETR